MIHGDDEGGQFLVSKARQTLYEELPPKLQQQFAFRHFLTDHLDPDASSLSIKYFALVVIYFCAVFKLEGRRKQYEERETEKSGRDFARAHRRAQAVFKALSTVYSTILMRYNCHTWISYEERDTDTDYPARGDAATRPGHKKILKEKAFKFSSDEMIFYEKLYQMTIGMVRLAFSGDSTVQALVEAEANKLFRSKSFLFHEQHRFDTIQDLVLELDRKSKSVLENNLQLAEMLTPQALRLTMKYANQQRTPFLSSQLPGGTKYIKYQRVRKAKVSEPSATEKVYTTEMTKTTFSIEHRSLKRLKDNVQQLTLRPGTKQQPFSGSAKRGQPNAPARATGFLCSREDSRSELPEGHLDDIPAVEIDEPEEDFYHGEDAQAHEKTVDQALVVPKMALPMTTLSGKTNVPPSERSETVTTVRATSSPGREKQDISMGSTLHSVVQEEENQWLNYLSRPAVQWRETDVFDEISAIYQALANGVIVTNLGIPQDLLLNYDDDGMLVPQESL
jgi:hypothetical protein